MLFAELWFGEVLHKQPERRCGIFYPVAYQSIIRSPKEVGTVSAMRVEQFSTLQALAIRLSI